MRRATVVLHGELADLAGGDRIEVEFELPRGLRDLVQSVGVPHVEAGKITVDGLPAGWDERIDDGAVIEAWPSRGRPAGEIQFVADVHLGALARRLRLLGFDTVWEPAMEDDAIVAIAAAERRVLLTRDRGILNRSSVQQGHLLRTEDPDEQLREVVSRFDLRPLAAPFTRCTACNGVLREDSAGAADVPADVARRRVPVKRCPSCGRVYWEGSHLPVLRERVQRALSPSDD